MWRLYVMNFLMRLQIRLLLYYQSLRILSKGIFFLTISEDVSIAILLISFIEDNFSVLISFSAFSISLPISKLNWFFLFSISRLIFFLASSRIFFASCFALLRIMLYSEIFFLDTNPIDELWKDQPPYPQSTIFNHPLKYAGQDRKNKNNR